MHRRCLMVVLGGLLLPALLPLVACGGPTISSAKLLQDAQATFNADQTLHFVMQVENVGTIAGADYDIQSANGDVARPDKLKANANLVTALGTVDTQLIIIGSRGWFTNPLTGKLEPSNAFNGFAQLFDPQRGIGSLLPTIKNPSTPSDGSANGVPCWKVTGALDASAVAALASISGASTGTIAVSVCVGKNDSQLHQVILKGKLNAHDSDGTTRTILFSAFNTPVTIEAPSV